jgi:hypothetical protein
MNPVGERVEQATVACLANGEARERARGTCLASPARRVTQTNDVDRIELDEIFGPQRD